MNFKKSALFIVLIWGIDMANAQQNTLSTGGNATGNGGTVSYSIGQIDYSTNTGSTGMATQGVQQPYEIFTVGGVENLSIRLSISVYPNPSADFLFLNFENTDFKNSCFELTDISGKIITSQPIANSQTLIDMKNLAAATYFLKIKNAQSELKIFKIIKP
ncbi:MAG: T9SS type A sorting domain-containing protein [Bacteroidia bacterium]